MPYLKELDLGCRELDKNERRRFTNEVRSVCALVTRHLPKIANEKYKKILVLCVSSQPKTSSINQLGVAFVEVQRDARAFFCLSNREKQRWAHAALREGTMNVTDSHGFEPNMLIDAFQQAQLLEFENTWRWGVKASNNRRLKAEVWVEHDVEECRLLGVITTRTGDRLASDLLISTVPDEWAFDRYLGKLRWEDERTAVLDDKSGARVGTITLPT
jgi:hypothetical protein